VAVHRGTLTLMWLALIALVPLARGDEPAQTSPDRPAVLASGSDEPLPLPNSKSEAGDVAVIGGVLYDSEVEPVRYVGRPGEPVGFSASHFDPAVRAAAMRRTSNLEPVPAPVPEAVEGEYYEGDGEYYEGAGSYEGPIEHEGPFMPMLPAQFGTSGEWLRNGCYYADFNAIYYNRQANVKNDVPLAADYLPIPGASIPIDSLNVRLDLGYEPGLQATVGRYLGRDVRNRDHSVEFTFLGLTHWEHARTLTANEPGTINLTLPPHQFRGIPEIPVYQDSDMQGYNETSDMNSYEANYRLEWRLGRDRMVYSRDNSWVRQATPTLTCAAFAGVRAVIVNESIKWIASNEDGFGSYNVVTHNNLVGPQFGSDLFFERAYWRVGMRAKAGGLVNFASQSSTVRILDGNGAPLVPNRDEYVKDHSMSFVGGLSFIGEYRFTPNFGIRSSFDLLWVTDLALAQNQLTFFPSNPPEISDSHSLFFNGFTLGLEWHR